MVMGSVGGHAHEDWNGMSAELPGTEVAKRLLTRPEGATMAEVIAATGGPQYNLLKRLEGRGYRIRKTKEGNETRYFVDPPAEPCFEAIVTSKGQITVPREIRERLGVRRGGKLRLVVESENRVVMSPVSLSVRRLFGILGKPPRHMTIEDMDDAIAEAVVEKHRRKIG